MNEPAFPESTPAIEDLDFESNLVLGLIAGGIAMLISAMLWGAITYFTEYQISWMAIGVGFFVGFVIQKFGKGKTLIYGISAAILSLLGCILGNFLFYNGVIAREENLGYFEVMTFFVANPGAIFELFRLTFEFMDLLFYALAAYIGFQTAVVKRAPSRPRN